MKTARIPSPYDFDDPESFFAEFIALNAHNAEFSHRTAARWLHWPLSYLADVAAGRRNLTPARAVEFARAAGFDPLATERLILLGLHATLPERLRDLGMSPTLSSKGGDAVAVGDAVDKTHSRLLLSLIVFETIKWLGRANDAGEIASCIRTVEATVDDVEAVIESLVGDGVLRSEPDGSVTILRDSLVADEIGFEQVHQQGARSLMSYVERPARPHSLNVCFAPLSRSAFAEYRRRLIGLRNWFERASALAAKSPDQSDVLLYQLDLNLFPVTARPASEEGPDPST